jgi:hypothetical protein
MRFPVVIFCTSLLAACSEPDEPIPGGEVSYTEQRAPCGERDPLRRLYWGDLHVHTKSSWDAYAYGLTVSPDQAYAFGRGGKLNLPPAGSRQVMLDRPLDFVSLTDHSEFLGETRLCTTPGSAAYDSETCVNFRKLDAPAVTAWGLQLIIPEGNTRFPDVCGADGAACVDEARRVWKELGAAADRAYDRTDACSFVTFVGYEYTGTPKATNMHRNVIFRNASVIETPVSYYEAPDAWTLWSELDARCAATPACDVMVIPHNMNMSNGSMFFPDFKPRAGLGSPAEAAALRARMEPVLEMFQHKGDQECAGGLAGESDPLCKFEKERPASIVDCEESVGWGGMNDQGCISRRDFLRGILAAGMAEQAGVGLNPFRLGVVGSTDSHNGTAGLTREKDWPGHVGFSDDTVLERLGPGNVTHRGLVNNPGGLAAVWAVERSRDAIFEAMRRREVYATSGTRITVRFFGGRGLPEDLCDRADWLERAYRAGVPMGGVLAGGGGAPRFVVRAARDQKAAPLQQVQIVKVWLDSAGVAHHEVFRVAGDPKLGTVDPATCKTDGAGEEALCAVWQDPAFDARHGAAYYARVLEVPTCRWSTWQCNGIPAADRPPGCSDARIQPVLQERAWSSPIWYEVAP